MIWMRERPVALLAVGMLVDHYADNREAGLSENREQVGVERFPLGGVLQHEEWAARVQDLLPMEDRGIIEVVGKILALEGLKLGLERQVGVTVEPDTD